MRELQVERKRFAKLSKTATACNDGAIARIRGLGVDRKFEVV